MSNSIFYPTVELIIETHDKVIDESGGCHGLRDIETLKSIVEFIQHDLYYPDFDDKLCHLIYSINKSHVFVDGNKRASLSAGALFMLGNGWSNELVDWYVVEFEDIVVWLAEGKIDKEILIFALRALFIRFLLIGILVNEGITIKKRIEAKNKVKTKLEQSFKIFKVRDNCIKEKMSNVLVTLDKKYLSNYSRSYYYEKILRRILEDVAMQ